MSNPYDQSEPLSLLREFRSRLARGEQLTAAQFIDDLGLKNNHELCVDLIFAEFLEREHRGDRDAQTAILSAYPDHANEIQLQIELHKSLESDASLTPSPSSQKTPEVSSVPRSESDEKPLLPSIPGFDVIAPLGRGGMGVVYLAKELELNRLVAIKLLIGGELSSADHRRRFRAEARAAASLRHPNIVQVDDVGEINDQPFIVMEYVPGGTMEEFLRTNRTTPRDAASFVRRVAWAVHAAHQSGIIHRDLKPGNILLSSYAERSVDSRATNDLKDSAKHPLSRSIKSRSLIDYEPKITDFGLAKSLQSADGNHSAMTVKGDVLGTPCYMSPEQVLGENIGPGVDIYSLGSILYEMLSGKPPFQRASPWETMQCVLENEPPTLASNLPADLRTICNKCLAKAPEQRYSSMAALAVDLGNFLEGRPIEARPVGNFTRLIRWARRNVAVASSITAVFVTLTTLLIVTMWSRWSLQHMLDETTASKSTESKALASMREQMWENLLSQAESIQTSQQIGQRYRSLENVREAISLLEIIGDNEDRRFKLRNTAIASLPLVDIQRVHIAKLASTNQEFLSADTAFHRFALRQPDGSIHVLEPEENKLLHVLSAEQASNVLISPDGSHMIVIGPECFLQSFSSNDSKRLLGTNLQWPVFSPDSRWIAAYDENGLFLYDVERNQTQQINDTPWAIMPMAFAPDANRLALVSQDQLLVIDLESTGNRLELPCPTLSQLGNTLAWHPSGDFLAAGLYADRVIHVWHLPTRSSAKSFHVSGEFHNLQFDSTGQFLIKASMWGGSREIYSYGTEESLLHLPNNVGVAFGRDGSGSPLALSNPINGMLDAWRLENQTVTRFLEPAQYNRSQRSHCQLSSCGRWLLVNCEYGFEIYDVIRGTAAGCLPIGPLSHSGVTPLDNGNFAILKSGTVLQWSIQSEGFLMPEITRLPDGLEIIEVSSDLRWGICSGGDNIFLHDFTGAQSTRLLGSQSDVRSAAFDLAHGKVATASWNIPDGVVIWDIETAHEVTRLPQDRHCAVRYSPNGQYLFTSAAGGTLWDVDSWTPWRLNSPDASGPGFGFAFSPDSKWFVHTSGNGVLKIQSIDRRVAHAVLTDPDQHHYLSLAFSADNSSLFGITNGRDCFIKQWDLNRVDQQLSSLRLPTLSLQNTSVAPVSPVLYGPRLRTRSMPEVDSLIISHLRTQIETAITEKRWESVLGILRSAIWDLPENDTLLTDLAWYLVTLPQEHANRDEALIMMERAIQGTPSERTYIVFGFVLLQNQKFEDAITVLSKIPYESGEMGRFVNYMLAWAAAELGRHEESSQWYAQAQAHGDTTEFHALDLKFRDWKAFLRTVRDAVHREHESNGTLSPEKNN